MNATTMNARRLTRQALRAAFVAVALCAGTANAAITYLTGANGSNIPGLTGFATTGAMMDGMAVTVTFSGGLTETIPWGDTGGDSGGVTGAGWALSVDGDTFTAPWNFTIAAGTNLGQVQTILLDGLNTFTVFDRTEPSDAPSFGTPGSAQGRDWECFSGECGDAIVTYDWQVSVGGNAAVGDLWQTVLVDFLFPDVVDGPDVDHGPRTDFQFRQDTDNDSRLTQVPAPGTLALLGGALAALGFARRRSTNRA